MKTRNLITSFLLQQIKPKQVLLLKSLQCLHHSVVIDSSPLTILHNINDLTRTTNQRSRFLIPLQRAVIFALPGYHIITILEMHDYVRSRRSVATVEIVIRKATMAPFFDVTVLIHTSLMVSY